MFNLEIEIKYMIKNNTLQVNSTNNFVKKNKDYTIQFGYRFFVATALATTIQSCGSSVGYKGWPEEQEKMQQALQAEEKRLEADAKRLEADAKRLEAEEKRLEAEAKRLKETNEALEAENKRKQKEFEQCQQYLQTIQEHIFGSSSK